MDFLQAIAIAQQLKNHFRAFEKLEELLVFAASVQDTLQEKQRLLEAKVNAIAGAERDIARIEAEVRKAKASHAALLEQHQKEVEGRQSLAEEAQAARNAVLDREFLTKRDELDAKLVEINKHIAERQALAAELDSAVQEKRETLSALREKVRSVLDD